MWIAESISEFSKRQFTNRSMDTLVLRDGDGFTLFVVA
jgi:hypothetical protein